MMSHYAVPRMWTWLGLLGSKVAVANLSLPSADFMWTTRLSVFTRIIRTLVFHIPTQRPWGSTALFGTEKTGPQMTGGRSSTGHTVLSLLLTSHLVSMLAEWKTVTLPVALRSQTVGGCNQSTKLWGLIKSMSSHGWGRTTFFMTTAQTRSVFLLRQPNVPETHYKFILLTDDFSGGCAFHLPALTIPFCRNVENL